MKSRRKIFAHSALWLAVALACAALYLRIGIFPGRLRPAAIQKIGEWTHRQVTFDKAVYVPFHGLSLTRVGILDADGKPLLQARRVTVNVRLLPFLREKKIVIDRLLLDNPKIDWVLDPAAGRPKTPAPKTVLSGQIDVPVLPGHEPPDPRDLRYGPDIFLPENVFIERIEIARGYLTLRAVPGGETAETFSAIDLRLTMPKAPLLRFEGRVELGQTPYASVDLSGSWDLARDRYEFFLRTQSGEVPGWLIDYQQGHFLILREGRLKLETHLFSGQDSSLLFKTKADLDESVLKLNDSRFSGQMRLEAEGAFDGFTKRFARYRGRLEMVKVDVRDLSKTLDALDGVSGSLRFEPDLLVVESLAGRYKDIAFDASGAVRSFKQLKVDGEVRTRLPVERVLSFLPEPQRAKLKDFVITGQCETRTELSGSLRKDGRIETENRVLIQSATVRNEAKKLAWTDVSGQIRLGSEGTRVERAEFTSGGKRYGLGAFIPKDVRTPGSLRLRTEGREFSAEYTVQGDTLVLRDGRASLPGLSAVFRGRCVRWTDPWLELDGTATLDLQKLELPDARGPRPLAALSGRLSGPFTLSGAWDRPLDWDLKMDAEGAPVFWKGRFRLDSAQLQLRMKDRRLSLPYIRAAGYGGSLGGELQADLSGKKLLFTSKFYLNNVDLSAIGPQLDPPNEKLRGTAIGNLVLAGTFGEPESWRGDGSFSITKGHLGQTSRFKAMGHLPLVKVEGLELVTFEEMSATFRVRDKTVFTEDLALLGDSVDLSLDGAIGFDQSLDLDMNIQYSEEVLQGALITGGLAPLMVQQAGNFISQHHVSGTLKDPKFEKMLAPSGRAVGKKLAGIVQSVVP